MKKIIPILCAALTLIATLNSCLKNSTADEYKEWRQQNEEWFKTQSNNNTYFTVVTPPWDPTAHVLIHWHNDTMLTKNNLKPLLTSTVDVKYKGWTINGTAFDSSYVSVNPRDSIFRAKLNTGVIIGWPTAITRMHVGDSCRVVIPYHLGYGAYSAGTVIKPYSTLIFDIKLDDIYGYETH